MIDAAEGQVKEYRINDSIFFNAEVIHGLDAQFQWSSHCEWV